MQLRPYHRVSKQQLFSEGAMADAFSEYAFSTAFPYFCNLNNVSTVDLYKFKT